MSGSVRAIRRLKSTGLSESVLCSQYGRSRSNSIRRAPLKACRRASRHSGASCAEGNTERLAYNPGPRSDLFVDETVGPTVESADVEMLGLGTRKVAGDNDSIARRKGFRGHAGPGQFSAIVHFEPPVGSAVVDSHVQKRMRIDVVEFGHRCFDGDLAVGVKDAGNRMMGVDGVGANRDCRNR